MSAPKPLYATYHNPLLIRPTRPLPRAVAVVGAGTIGPDIGYYLKSALPSVRLYLVDVVQAALDKAEKRLNGYAQKAVERRKMKPDQAKAVLDNIVYTLDYHQVADCQLVIEAATENIPLKQKIFETLEGIVQEGAILTSNTSSIPADRIFARMKRPERSTVTHFFAPAWRSLPVEVISWERASREVVDDLCWFFARTGKVPILTDNAICFMLDRIFDNWCNEAAHLLSAATAGQIDKVAEAFVFAGPFFVLNLANGNPIVIETNTLQMEEGAHYLPAPILASVDRWNTPRPGSRVEVPETVRKGVRDRLLGILFSQSFDIVDRGIGAPEDLNFGCQIALGFREGPLDVMRELGKAEVERIMTTFLEDRPGFPAAAAPFERYQDFRRYVLVDEIDGVKILTLRRPQAMNSLNVGLCDEIRAVLEEDADNPAVRGFVITGYGTRAFSAGADIGRFPEHLGHHDSLVRYAKDMARVQLFMDRLNKPLVAAINGLALGGGLELALRCHGIVAVRQATFQFPEVTLGIVPGIGGCVVPYRRWPAGAGLFHEMLCLAKAIRMDEAARVGMVDRVVDDPSDLIPEALALVKALAGRIQPVTDEPVKIPPVEVPGEPMAGKLRLSRETVSIIARTIEEAAAAPSFQAALEAGYQGFGAAGCAAAAREGISAFLEKRAPDFKQ